MHPWRHRGGVWGLQNPRGEGKLHATISYTGWQRVMAFSKYQRTKEETRRLHAAWPTLCPTKMEVWRDMLPHPGSWVSGKGGANRKWDFEEGKRGADPNCLRNFVNIGDERVTWMENRLGHKGGNFKMLQCMQHHFWLILCATYVAFSFIILCLLYKAQCPDIYALFCFILGFDLIHELCI
jgi:hypothetical protein